MLAKYNVEYSIQFKRHSPAYNYYTDDPVACIEFLLELFERKLQVRSIHHNGVDLPQADFDKMVKTAASMLASKAICFTLNIPPDEAHYRFGFAG